MRIAMLAGVATLGLAVPAAVSGAVPARDVPAALIERLDAELPDVSRPSPSAATVRRGGLFPCDEAPEGMCGRVEVPLDRGDPQSETIPLFFEYYEHTDPAPTDEAILVTLGGPGASATQEPFFSDHMLFAVMGPLLETRDLIFLDQRGVGRSRPIDCPDLQNGTNHPYGAVRKCGEQLGSASSLYGTHDIALDIEAVRDALGIETLDLYGGSYAAMDMQGYAARFPEHVRSAVLDSPTTMVDFDPFYASGLFALERGVQLICERSANCSGERGDGSEDLEWLLERLRRNPVKGTGLDTLGQPHRVRVSEAYLLWSILQSDEFSFTPNSEIAAAADALRTGDKVPLLRLAAEAESGGPIFGPEDPVREFSAGQNWARFCTDAVDLPWDTSESTSVRRQQWADAADALPDDYFSPFSQRAWLAPFPIGPIAPEACVTWPAAQQPVTPPIPDDLSKEVPALILSGDLDYVTPTADAVKLEDAWPHSELVELANTPHHTAVTPRFECAAGIIQSFIADLEPGDFGCADDLDPLRWPAVGRFARIADRARPADVAADSDESTELDRKVATVAVAAVTDAIRRTFIQPGPGPGPGLRGGTFETGFGERRLFSRLARARFARDVAVSGRVRYGFFTEEITAKRLKVEGPGGHDGRLRVSGVWFGFAVTASVLEIRGRLGGRRVALTVPAT